MRELGKHNPLTNSQVIECSRSDSSRRMTMLEWSGALLAAGVAGGVTLNAVVACSGECDGE